MNQQTTFPGRFILSADITLSSPMHISAIEKGRYVYEGVNFTKLLRFDSGPGAGIQCTLTRTARLGNKSFEVKTDDGTRMKFGVDVPVIPASTLGGMMRSAAADLICKSLVARDLTLSTDAYNTLYSGSATTTLSSDQSLPEVVAMARKDAFLSNFGGTSFALASRSVVSNGMPLIQMTTDMLMTPPLVNPLSMERMDDMTAVVAIIRKDAAGDMKGEHQMEVIKLDDLIEYIESKAADTAQAAQSKAKQKEAKKAGVVVEKDKKKDLRTLGAMESVNAGLSFALRIQVDAMSPAHLGLMVLALQKILRSAQVGGKAARGFGQFVCEQSRIYQIDTTTNRPMSETGNHLFGDRNTGYAIVGFDDTKPSAVVLAVDAANDYLENIDPELIEAFATTNAKVIKRLYSGKPASAETV